MSSNAIDRHLSPQDEVLTLSEAATYLKLADRTIHRMIQRSEIPCARVGGQWRFLRSVLDDWLISRMQVLPRNELVPLLGGSDSLVTISSLIDRRFVVDPVKPGSVAEVLTQLAGPLGNHGVIANPRRFVELLVQREQLSSTAIGDVAVPHVRKPQDNPVAGPVLVPGVCREGVAFGGLDDRPVYFFFLLCSTSEVVHLRLLKRITMLFRDGTIRDDLLACDSPEALLATLARHESRLTGGN
jgi:PTS system nitrogen regulatory IIA component